MEAPSHIIEFLREREGWVAHVYTDTEGFPTAGMGHLLTREEQEEHSVGDPVAPAILQRWAREDAGKAYRAATTQAKEIGLGSDAAFLTVLTSVNFQLGLYWRNKFPDTWKAIVDGRWKEAARNVLESRWARQTPSRAREFAQALESKGEAAKPRASRPRAAARAIVGGALLVLVATLAAAFYPSSN